MSPLPPVVRLPSGNYLDPRDVQFAHWGSYKREDGEVSEGLCLVLKGQDESVFLGDEDAWALAELLDNAAAWLAAPEVTREPAPEPDEAVARMIANCR